MSKNHRLEIRASGASTVKVLATAALVLSASFASFAVYSQTPGELSNQHGRQGTELSRAEVIADLVLWQRAGADRYEFLAHSYGLETQAYQDAYQEYLRLRHSAQFQIEVQKAQKD